MTVLIQQASVENVEEIDTMLEGMNRVDDLFESMRAFTVNLNDWDGEELQAQATADMAEHLSEEARATLIFQVLTKGFFDDALDVNTTGKQFAVVLAEKMGPDWAQWLYQFAKIVTKLA